MYFVSSKNLCNWVFYTVSLNKFICVIAGFISLAKMARSSAKSKQFKPTPFICNLVPLCWLHAPQAVSHIIWAPSLIHSWRGLLILSGSCFAIFYLFTYELILDLLPVSVCLMRDSILLSTPKFSKIFKCMHAYRIITSFLKSTKLLYALYSNTFVFALVSRFYYSL